MGKGTNLDDVLRSRRSSSTLPNPLPSNHVTRARWFRDIVRAGSLEPRPCRVFGRNLLYLFYGGSLYRLHPGVSSNAVEYPVGFLFSPDAAGGAECLYPFDTGAMSSGRFGGSLPGPLGDYRCSSLPDLESPRRLVCELYATNDRYYAGQPREATRRMPRIVRSLLDFLARDLTAHGVDHRHWAIECQLERALTLDRSLLWVGFPEVFVDAFAELCNHLAPYVPESFMYKSRRAEDPAQLCAVLEREAATIVRRYADRP